MKTFKEWQIDFRRELHRNPELSGQESETTRKVACELEKLGIEVRLMEGMTGLVGVIRGEKTSEPSLGTIALRADMDALPLEEKTGLSYASAVPGVMHACGHDANTAIALGVGRMIRESGLMDNINGTVKLIFQPSEERLGGSLSMIERGVLETPKVDRIIAGHMDPNFPVGQVGVFRRTGHAASDPFELTVRGTGSHGARPHKGRNPITAGALFVSQLDGIVLKNVPPVHTAVISVGMFQAGEAPNIIPDTCVIRGTVRTHDPEVRETVIKEMKALAQGVGVMSSVSCDLTFGPGAPMGLNNETVSRSLYRASADVLGEDKVTVLPFIMGSDDFYFFAQKCPAAMMRIGCADPGSTTAHPLHSPEFTINEDVLEIGSRILFRAVEQFFSPEETISAGQAAGTDQ